MVVLPSMENVLPLSDNYHNLCSTLRDVSSVSPSHRDISQCGLTPAPANFSLVVLSLFKLHACSSCFRTVPPGSKPKVRPLYWFFPPIISTTKQNTSTQVFYEFNNFTKGVWNWKVGTFTDFQLLVLLFALVLLWKNTKLRFSPLISREILLILRPWSINFHPEMCLSNHSFYYRC